MTDFEISTASADDLEMMAAWAADEGWNPGTTDWLAFAAADPGGFLIGRLAGEPVVSISVVKYGERFGFLGFYIARPVVRGKGYGLQIWRAGMARMAGRNVGLDGVVAQQGNYAKSGFRLAWNNIRHEGPAPAAVAPPPGVRLSDARTIGFETLAAYDRRFFPEARDSFLASWIALPQRASLVAIRDGTLEGLAVMRAARAAFRVGPLYASSPAIATALVGRLAATMAAKTVAVDVPDVNKSAMKWAEGLGLGAAFETARMYTGANPDVDLAGTFGITSFELG